MFNIKIYPHFEYDQGYSCGKAFVKLEEIPPLKDIPAPTLSVEEEERIEQDLFKNYDLKMFKEAGDLSSKVPDYRKKIYCQPFLSGVHLQRGHYQT